MVLVAYSLACRLAVVHVDVALHVTGVVVDGLAVFLVLDYVSVVRTVAWAIEENVGFAVGSLVLAKRCTVECTHLSFTSLPEMSKAKGSLLACLILSITPGGRKRSFLLGVECEPL
jgi:hypothetical protein